MKTLFALNLLIFVTACFHPLEIVGTGDIISFNVEHDCLQAHHSYVNNVIGHYDVT